MADDEYELFSTEEVRVPKPPPPASAPAEVEAAYLRAPRENVVELVAAIRNSVEMAQIGLFTDLRYEKLMHALRQAIIYRNSRVKRLAAGKALRTTADVEAASIPEIFIALLALDVGRVSSGSDDDGDIAGDVFFAALGRVRDDAEKRFGIERFY